MTKQERNRILKGLKESASKGAQKSENERTEEMQRRGFLTEGGNLKRVYGG